VIVYRFGGFQPQRADTQDYRISTCEGVNRSRFVSPAFAN
jgi:hypothetical protein